jgi:hypothetical protein
LFQENPHHHVGVLSFERYLLLDSFNCLFKLLPQRLAASL